MSEWTTEDWIMPALRFLKEPQEPQERREPTVQPPAVQMGSEPFVKDDANKRRRKLRGPMMALADEDLRLSIAGKQQLGA